MTLQPTITHTHTLDGTHTLPDWLPHDGTHPVLPGRDDTTPPQPGWTLVRWSDGHVTVASPQVAARAYGPDGMHGRLQRAEAQLAAVADLIAGHEGDEWAAHPATTALRGILDGDDHATAQPERWLHIAFTSPDETTANTSALSLRDHLAAEFDGVGMRITTNAVEAAPILRDPCPHCESSPTLIPRDRMDEHVATAHPEVQTLDTTAGNPAATEATDTWQEPAHPNPCTATIEGRATPGGRRVQCTREARHPENHVGPKLGANGRVLWTDHQPGATPHKEQP